MTQLTSIEWTDRSANAFRARRRDTGKVGHHCVKWSKGCAFCYSEAWNKWRGTGLPFTAGAEDQVDLFLDERVFAAILRLKTPQRFFMFDMTDWAQAAVPDEFIVKAFAAMAMAEWHTFQLLTKRSGRMRELLGDPGFPVRVGEAIDEWGRGLIDGKIRGDWGLVSPTANELRRGRGGWPLANVWLGVSVEDQAAADERIPHLLATPAAVRFLSVEPLLGPVDLREFRVGEDSLARPLAGKTVAEQYGFQVDGPRIHWVIVGGESGPKARPCDLAWIRSIVRQCREAAVPAFVKQLGSCAVDAPNGIAGKGLRVGSDAAALISRRLRDPKGGNIGEFPADLRIRQFPQIREMAP